MSLIIETVRKNPLIIYPSNQILNAIITPQPYYGVDVIHHINNNYNDLNNNRQIIKQVKKYYYYKIIEKWLNSSYVDLLGFFKIEDGKVVLINNISEYSQLALQSQTERQIIQHIEDNVLSKNIIGEFLTKFVEKYSYKWYKLQNHENELKEYLHYKIKKFFESLIKN